MSTLPLTPVVNAYYNLQAISAPRSGFNLGAIVGNTLVNHAPVTGTIFVSVDEMIEAGYSLTDPEVLAAQVYFAATSHPGQLYVYTWIDEATKAYSEYTGPISNGNTVAFNSTTYTIGDGTSSTTTVENLITVVTTAGGTASYSNQVLRISLSSSLTGSEAVAPSLTVSKGTGDDVEEVKTYTGFDSKSAVTTVQEMRTSNSEWYALAFCKELTNEEILSVASYIESSSIYSTFFIKTSSMDVVNNVEGNLFEQLRNLKYNRTIGIATQQPYTHIGAMAYPMGQISDKANSSFTIGLKSIPGCLTDSYTSQQVRNIESNYGNVYISRGSYYNLLEEGRVFSGAWYDEIIQLDKLANTIQLDVMDLLYQNPKIAQTEGGVSRIMAKISGACQTAVKTGFIAPGQWNGVEVLNLTAGDYLPDGYLIQAESINDQSQADRDARKCPYIYVAVKLAGAIQSVVIQIDVNR